MISYFNDIEISRFEAEGYLYIIYTKFYQYKDLNIAYPFFQVSYKSSKKAKGKLKSKEDNIFKLTNLKRPLPVARKVLGIYEDYFKQKKVDVVIFTPYEDNKRKRKETYLSLLSTIGYTNNIFELKGEFIAVSNRIINNKQKRAIKEELTYL